MTDNPRTHVLKMCVKPEKYAIVNCMAKALGKQKSDILRKALDRLLCDDAVTSALVAKEMAQQKADSKLKARTSKK